MSDVLVNEHILDGMRHYLRALREQGAVDELKMKFAAYKSLEECMELWGIEPYKSRRSSAKCV